MYGIVLKVFTHPACAGCGPAVEMGWNLTKEFKDLQLQTIKLENKEGLDQAHQVGIKTIPTLIYYYHDVEEKRFVGLPEAEDLRNALISIIQPRQG